MTLARRRHVLLRPGVAIPFLIVALVWGGTWIVIRDQLAAAPPSWSVTYRFAIATVAMFILVARLKRGFGMTAGGHLVALLIGVAQFFMNFNFVYRAELYITSGIVAVLFGLLMVPNAILARIFLGTEITVRFVIGTVIAIIGIALLLLHEFRVAPENARIGLGIGFTVLAILSASVANVMQASKTAQGPPVLLLLAWAMLWGTLLDGLFAFAVAGPPVIPGGLRYWAGVLYLALLGSVVAFPLYFGIIRELGPGRAAYSGVLVPVVAMSLSTIFEGYHWSGLAVAGAVVALTGLVVALRGRVVEEPEIQ